MACQLVHRLCMGQKDMALKGRHTKSQSYDCVLAFVGSLDELCGDRLRRGPPHRHLLRMASSVKPLCEVSDQSPHRGKLEIRENPGRYNEDLCFTDYGLRRCSYAKTMDRLSRSVLLDQHQS